MEYMNNFQLCEEKWYISLNIEITDGGGGRNFFTYGREAAKYVYSWKKGP
jgi:hypothetical protein